MRIRIHPAVRAEVVYVASSAYGLCLSRTDVARVLSQFFTMDGVETADPASVLQALAIYASTALDWVDAILVASMLQLAVFSFDQDILSRGAAIAK